MSDFRLPKTFLPSAYAIDVDASPKRAGFSGSVTITGVLTEGTAQLVLHGRAIKVKKAVIVSGGKKVKAQATASKKHETLTLAVKAPLKKGKVSVVIDYDGRLDPAMHGLYLAKEGNERSLVSQCEATDARAIFPCLDEPEFKATLQWTVRTDPDLVVITNGIAAGTKKAKGKVVHTFKPTRKVSTYLAALTIGRYEGTKAEKVAGVACRVWASPGKSAQTSFAEEVTRYVLPWYENYFGQKYNYQKLDQVAVSGFDAGAMENIGAIFYRQSRLLMSPGQTSWATQKSIAEVVAHEIAHQWFGNRVTMKWWDDLWLNEAFATWVSYKAIDKWKPSWRMWDDYQEDKESALYADALVNTHPIYTPVKSPAEATELFDVITYSKGGAVLRMLENYLGEDAFASGMRLYMDAFKDGNASGRDLWAKLGEASGEPVSELMSSWVDQPGFPLLHVEKETRAGKTILRVSQRRFFSNPSEKDTGQTWAIPLVVRYGTISGKVREQRFVLREKQAELALDGDATWVMPNAHAIGFFRLQLSDSLVEAVVKHGMAHLSPAERLALIEDRWACVRNGTIGVERFMQLIAAFAGEEDYVVVRALASRLGMIDQRLVQATDRPAMQAFVRNLFGHLFMKLGDPVANESPERSVARATVFEVLGEVGESPDVVAAAERFMLQEMKDPQSVEPNLAGTVVHLAAAHGDAKRLASYVDTFKARVKAKATPELQARYLAALAGFRQPALVSKVLAMCLDGTVPQDQLRLILSPLLGNRDTQVATWKFLQKEWKKIGPRVGNMGLSRLVEATGALPPKLAGEVEAFFKKNPVPEAVRALAKALEAMSLNRELVSREGARLSAFLQANAKAA